MKRAMVVFVVSISLGQPKTQSIINFAHLQHLTESIVMNGQAVDIVHVYANYPAYEWQGASDSGEEGIACVDDAARAAVVYLRSYELRHDTADLSHARALLRFVMAMQTDDGEFYNFILSDHSINRDGRTSRKSFGWWAARGLWAMALGCRVMDRVDPPFASELRRRFERSLPHVNNLMKQYGATKIIGGFRTPQWLLFESASDATTELMLGLVEYYRATHDGGVKGYITKLAEGMMVMQDGDAKTFPFGVHRSWETTWHAWGNSQTHVLAYAGRVLGDSAMIRSAQREAVGFYSRLLINGFLKEWDFATPEKKAEYEQIAYGIRPMALGLLQSYEATHNDIYLKLAGLTASWLFGNNVLGCAMYDSTTGRCFDGIIDSTRLNRNSGAESTIEALYTLVEMEQYPLAMKYVQYKKAKSKTQVDSLSAWFQDGVGERVTLTLDLQRRNLVLCEGSVVQELYDDQADATKE